MPGEAQGSRRRNHPDIHHKKSATESGLSGKSRVVSGRDALAPGTGFAGVVPLGVSAPRGVGFGAELCGGCLGRRDAEGDGVSEGFELADEAACTSGFVDALVVVVGSEIGVGGGRVG